ARAAGGPERPGGAGDVQQQPRSAADRYPTGEERRVGPGQIQHRPLVVLPLLPVPHRAVQIEALAGLEELLQVLHQAPLGVVEAEEAPALEEAAPNQRPPGERREPVLARALPQIARSRQDAE